MKRDLMGAPERRILSTPLEVRAESDDHLVLEGYASVFDAPYDIWGGPSKGGFTEVVDKRAFDKTLAGKPDLHLLINHEGMPLARTKSGTLQLSADDHGLKVRAELDRRDPDVQRLEVKMARGDMDEMSFAFRTIREEWSEEDSKRRLTELSLDKGDVSVVNFGANPATHTSLEGAIRALAEVQADELAALRANLDDLDDLVSRAQTNVGAYLRAQRGTRPSSVAAARALIEAGL
jgi:HK97 family phage prohead protease